MPTRVEQAHANLQAVVDRFRTDEFEPVHAGRWRHKATGMHVETGYSYGEGVVRFYNNGDRVMTDRVILRGSDNEMDGVNSKFNMTPSH